MDNGCLDNVVFKPLFHFREVVGREYLKDINRDIKLDSRRHRHDERLYDHVVRERDLSEEDSYSPSNPEDVKNQIYARRPWPALKASLRILCEPDQARRLQTVLGV